MDNIYLLLDFFNLKELIIIGTILFLLITVLLLFVCTLYLRIYYNTKNKFLLKKQDEWESSILKYISRKRGKANFTLDIKYKDFQIFGEFVENYLINLRGDDYKRIIQLLKDIGYGEMLMRALDKANKWGKAYAAHFSGLMEYKQTKAKLKNLVNDKSPVVCYNAFEAFNRFGSKKELSQIIQNIIKNKNISIIKIIEILSDHGTASNPILIKMLGDPEIDSLGKRLIVDILSFSSAIESSKAIFKLAKKTDDIELKIGCIKAIGSFEDPENASFFIENLNSENWVIRSVSARALGKIGEESAIPVLKNILYSDKNFWVRLYSAFALKQMHEKGLEALNEILKNHHDTQVSQIINNVIQAEENVPA